MHRHGYAVWWDDGDGARHAGRLEIGSLHALFSGNGNGELAVPLDGITAVEYARGEAVIHRNGEAPLRVGSLDAPGALRECAMHLATGVDRPGSGRLRS
jgi:hypothetical protein